MAMTPAPVLELATLRITVSQEEALAKQTAPINNTLRKAPGFQHITWGFQDEDPEVLLWLIGWETLAHHERLVASPEYGPFVEEISAFASPSRIHAPLTVPSGAAVVEWVTFTLAPDTDRVGFVSRARVLEDELRGARGFHGVSSASVIENERAVVALVGWDSVQAHEDWKKGQHPDVTKRLLDVFQGKDVVDASVWHVVVDGEAGPV